MSEYPLWGAQGQVLPGVFEDRFLCPLEPVLSQSTGNTPEATQGASSFPEVLDVAN